MSDPNTPPPSENDESRFAPPEIPDTGSLPAVEVDADELDALASELDALGIGQDKPEEVTFSTEADTRFPVEDEPVITLPALDVYTPVNDDNDSDAVEETYEDIGEEIQEAPVEEDLPEYEDEEPAFDVESALGAVSGLEEMFAIQEAEAALMQEEEDRLTDILSNPKAAPEPLALARGNPASWLPGLGLIAAGVWLTFANVTDTTPPPLIVIALLLGIFALALVVAWLASGRWSRGMLFIALWGLFSSAAVIGTGQFLTTGLPAALVMAIGGAFLLSGLFARPLSGVFALPGLLLLAGGGAALALALGVIPPIVLTGIQTGWIAIAVIAGLVLLLPIFRRLRG